VALVGEERERKLELLAELLVARGSVRTHTPDVRTALVDDVVPVAELACLCGAAGRVVLWIEVEDRPSAFLLGQAVDLPCLIGEGDLGSDVTRERGADVWGVSPEGAASHKKFREKFELPFTLLADEGHAVAETYGAWGEKQNYGRTYTGLIRSTFLIDPEGRIAKVWPKVKAQGHAEAVLKALDELQATPAS